jgi:hypothetical protein
VRHVAYFAGALTSGEMRPACLSYGQWRYFTITTTGPQDAALLAEVRCLPPLPPPPHPLLTSPSATAQLSAPVSSVLLRDNAKPTADDARELDTADVATPPGVLVAAPGGLEPRSVARAPRLLSDSRDPRA